MKKLFLPATLLLAVAFGSAHAQTKPKTVPKAAPAAGPRLMTPAGKPLYAGFYINGKLVNEIDCYGLDRVDVVYPFFNTLATAVDRYSLRVIGGSYDATGKFVVEYSRLYISYQGMELTAIREKYAERGYGIGSMPNQVEEFNNLRGNYPKSELSVGMSEAAAAFPALKYTNFDPATTKGSVVYYELYGSVIKDYKATYYSDGSLASNDAVYDSKVLYTSPKIKLTNRVLASTVAYKTGTPEPGTATATEAAPATKASRFGRAALTALNRVSASPSSGARAPFQLPSISDESCELKGTPLSLEQLQAVPSGGYGEELLTR